MTLAAAAPTATDPTTLTAMLDHAGPAGINWYQVLECAQYTVVNTKRDEQNWFQADCIASIFKSAKLALAALSGTLAEIQREAGTDALPEVRAAAIGKMAHKVLRGHGGEVAEKLCDLRRPPSDGWIFPQVRQLTGIGVAPLDWHALLRNAAEHLEQLSGTNPELTRMTASVARAAAEATQEMVGVLGQVVSLATSVQPCSAERIQEIMSLVSPVVDKHGAGALIYECPDECEDCEAAGSECEMADYIVSHGLGEATNAGVAYGLSLVREGDDVAGAAAEVVSMPIPGLVVDTE